MSAPQAAVAAAPLSCIETLYLTDGLTNNVRQVSLPTGPLQTGVVLSTPTGSTNANQLGVGKDGATAIVGTSNQFVKYTPATDKTVPTNKPSGAGAGQVGAVNPVGDLYYYGSYTTNTNLALRIWDPNSTEAPATGVVVNITLPVDTGGNGDIAFDKNGRLYIVAGEGRNARLFVADGTIPTSGTNARRTATQLSSITNASASTNGIAFGSDGYLYLNGAASAGTTSYITRANPITGAVVTGSTITLNNVRATDLGTCANPSTTEAVSTFPDGKADPSDSTTVVVGGGSYGNPGTAPDFPTSTPQPDGSSKTQPGIVLPGEKYTVTQTGNGTTNLGKYDTTWACTTTDGAIIAQGPGNTATYEVPTGTDGASITCAFDNRLLSPPTGVNDTASAAAGTGSVVLAGATNDTAGAGAIQPAQTVFTRTGGTHLDTNEGEWNIRSDGRIVFYPYLSFTGTTAPAEYRITDSNGLTATATATVTITSGPTATADARVTAQGTAVELMPLSNDTAGRDSNGAAGTIPATSLRFSATGQPSGATRSDDSRALDVPGEGLYVINAVSGVVTFTPDNSFYGVAQSVAYTFTDSLGNPSGSTITITVTEVTPTALSDSSSTPYGTDVTVDVRENDTAGPGGAIDQTVTEFTSSQATEGGKKLETAEGVWTVNPNGTVAFSPASGYSGTTPPVQYRVTDENGQTATANVSVTVRPGPSASADVDETDQNVDVTFPILDNDTPGLRVDGSSGAFDADSVRFVLTDGLPAGSEVSSDGRELTVAGEGVYTYDPSTREVTFDPETAFTGAATPVTYEVTDQEGNVAAATITITVKPVTPVVTDDAVKTPGNTPIVFDPLANDSEGGDSAPLVPGSVAFTDPSATDGGKKLVTDEGTWTIGDDGSIRFQPGRGFEGVAGPVGYEVRDTNGTVATGQASVTVGGGALAAPDADTTLQGQPIDVALLANDEASDLGTPCTEPGAPVGCDTGELDPSSVVFPSEGQPEGAVISEDSRILVVADEGRYEIDPQTGVVTFSPVPGFDGVASPVVYTVSDSNGATVSSTVTITVAPVDPIAVDDSASTVFDTPVEVELLANDAEGDEVVPLVPARTVFVQAGQPEGVTVSPDGKTLTIPGQGAYVLNEDGVAAFTPATGWNGTTTAVTYQIEDENGTTALADVQVTVRPGPIAQTDGETTLQGVAITLAPLENDTPSRNADDRDGAWDAASVVFPEDGQPEGAEVSSEGTVLTVPGEGRYAVDADGVVTFSPEPSFRGTASNVVYAAADANGNAVSSTITIVVTPVDPTAADDAASTPFGTPVTFDFAGDDEAGDPAVPLVVGSVVFEESGVPAGLAFEIRDEGKTIEITGEGVYTLREDGTVIFTPAAAFSGVTTAVAYTISDVNGTTATATLVVTVQPGPAIANDVDRTPQNTPVTVNVLANDAAGLTADGTDGTLDPQSVVFSSEGQADGATVSDEGKRREVPGQGVYTIDPVTGEITFTPIASFRGETTPVVYAVTDSLGNTASATLTITVLGVEPVARDNTANTTRGTAVTIDVLANDSGATGVPLDPSSLKLVDANGELVDRITVPGEGTWTVVDGTLVFTPQSGFRGTTTPVTYSVADANGTRATASATVTVGELPATGGGIPWLPIAGGLALLLAGLLLVMRRLRRVA